jgi:hypothetical protein
MPDTMSSGCPGTYTTTIGTHKYRVITTNATWDAQKTDCGNDATSGTYLAIPDDQTELDAIITASGKPDTWVGITSGASTAADSYQTVKGATFLDSNPLWDTGEPDHKALTGGATGNCVVADDTNNQLADDDCTKTRPAICECEP